MAKNSLVQSMILYPLSLLYGVGVNIRNLMFNKGIYEQESFDIPVISIGNLTVGGAGKTPHTEYVIEALCRDYRIGMLSRGYRRRTKGFIIASSNSNPEDIGDEPYQIYKKFENKGVMVAVCEKRVEGIKRMLDFDPKLNLIVLDDAFQHRFVKPRISILLTEHSNPLYNDHLLPLGRLREPAKAIERADIVILTKCPDNMKPVDFRLFKETFDLFPYQNLLFSKYRYLSLVPLFPEALEGMPVPDLYNPGSINTVLAVVGVTNPRPFIRYIRSLGIKVKIMSFGDHHNFSKSDMTAIRNKFAEIRCLDKYIITTEKDAVRLAGNPYFPAELRSRIFYIPIKVEFIPHDAESLETVLKQKLNNYQGN